MKAQITTLSDIQQTKNDKYDALIVVFEKEKSNYSSIIEQLKRYYFDFDLKLSLLYIDKINDYEELASISKAIPTIILHDDYELLIKNIMQLPQINFSFFLPILNFEQYNHNAGLLQFLIGNTSHFNELNLLAYQSYYLDRTIQQSNNFTNVFMYRLAEIQSDLTFIEPILRDADFVYLDLSVVKNSELYAIKNSLPAGFTNLELCKIFHYYGLSDKNQIIHISGYLAEEDKKNLASAQISQYLWHFLTALNLKKTIKSENIDYETYIIDTEKINLKFLKCSKTQRWWVEIDQNKLLPCSEDDFKQAKNGKLNNRIARYFV